MAVPKEFDRYIRSKEAQLKCRISGYCPVQAEGTVVGDRFYFRARWDEWSFSVADSPDVDPVDIQLPGQGFLIEEPYGKPHDFDAGWMPLDDAEAIIRRCARAYIESKIP